MKINKKIIVLILVALLATSCLRIGWMGSSPNPIEFPLPEDFFPETARVGIFHDSRDGVPSQQTSIQTIYFVDETAGENEKAAYVVREFHYEFQEISYFESDEAFWKRKDYNFFSADIKWAERYYLACGYHEIFKTEGCVFRGQYQHFLFSFSSSIGDFFTLKEFLDVVYYIDEMAGQEIMQ